MAEARLKLPSAADIELAVDVAGVISSGVRADAEPVGDGLDRMAAQQLSGNIELSSRQGRIVGLVNGGVQAPNGTPRFEHRQRHPRLTGVVVGGQRHDRQNKLALAAEEPQIIGGAHHALRALAQSMARELGPEGIHVVHPIIDGAIDTAFIRDTFPALYAKKDQDGILNPEHIADTYWMLHQQPRDVWTHEIDLRPWMESMVRG